MRIPLILCTLFSLSISLNAMEKPYHHVYENGKFKEFRNLPADVPQWGKESGPILNGQN